MHQIIKPKDKELNSLIHSFNIFNLNSKELSATGHTNKMVPDALPDVWLVRGGDLFYSYNDKDYKKLPKYFAWGLFDKHGFLKSEGNVSILSVKFYPWAFNLFFDKPLCRLFNSQVSLKELLPKEMLSRFQQINDYISPLDFIPIIENLLQMILKKGGKGNLILKDINNAIIESRGNIQISKLSDNLGISRQHLNRIFKRNFGLSIKAFIGIYRTRLCIDFELNVGTPSLTQLAYEFEFFDQAHFIKQFKEIVGETPRTYFSKKHIIKQHLI